MGQGLHHLKYLLVTLLFSLFCTALHASEAAVEKIENRVTAPSAPSFQTLLEADKKSSGCASCHTESDSKTMHANPAVVLGCADCHGGNAQVQKPDGAEPKDEAYLDAMKQAHVMPDYSAKWHWPSSANPKGSYTLLNKESPEYVRFVNPSDYRVVREGCGACHMPQILAAERSIIATGAMLFDGASYNNGILPFKRYILGEAYTRDGQPAAITPLMPPTEDMTHRFD